MELLEDKGDIFLRKFLDPIEERALSQNLDILSTSFSLVRQFFDQLLGFFKIYPEKFGQLLVKPNFIQLLFEAFRLTLKPYYVN